MARALNIHHHNKSANALKWQGDTLRSSMLATRRPLVAIALRRVQNSCEEILLRITPLWYDDRLHGSYDKDIGLYKLIGRRLMANEGRTR